MNSIKIYSRRRTEATASLNLFAPSALGSLIPGQTILCKPTKTKSPSDCPFYDLINSGLTIETQRAYIAGIIDGEGCVTITRRNRKRKNGVFCYYTCLISIVNTDKNVLNFIATVYGGWINTNRRVKENQKISYRWVWAGKKMKRLLRDTLPYLIIKKEQAKILLEFPTYEHTGWGWGPGRSKAEEAKQHDLWIKIKELNHRGKQVDKEASGAHLPIIGP